MSRFSRGSGILLHPTSLPSKYGIGDLGENLIKFLELLKIMHKNIGRSCQ